MPLPLDPFVMSGYVFDVFGLSFGEIAVIAMVALVILGPKELPGMLRSLGRGIAKLKRMSTDLRQQSGIDEIIREEGLQEELEALRALRSMSGRNVVESFIDNASRPKAGSATAAALVAAAPAEPAAPIELDGSPPDPEQEYPEIGCDAYGASYQPDTTVVAAEPKPEPEPKPAGWAPEVTS